MNASKWIKSDNEAQSKGEEVRGLDGIFINPSIKGQRIKPGQIHPTYESRVVQMVHQEGFSFLDFGTMVHKSLLEDGFYGMKGIYTYCVIFTNLTEEALKL